MSKKKKSVDDRLSEALDIEINDNPIVQKEESSPVKAEEPSSERQEDYNLVRNNLKDIIKTGQGAIDGILNVASEGESPRAYEVVSQLIKTVADANKDLVDLHKKMKDIEDVPKQSAGKITNNSIYVGSTKDLQKLIKDSRHQKDTIDADFEILEDDVDGKATKPELPR